MSASNRTTEAYLAFTAVLAKDPYDDALRLVFADWLEENATINGVEKYAADLRDNEFGVWVLVLVKRLGVRRLRELFSCVDTLRAIKVVAGMKDVQRFVSCLPLPYTFQLGELES